MEDQVIYQIYPKSFYDSNQDGIGDLRGIIEKLDYLKDLGVDMLWITPVFPSPQRDNGYDVADYRSIDPRYGMMETMEELIQTAKEKGMGIMMDMVFNHTSTDHMWFQKALQQDPIYKDYYIFRKGKANGEAPTNWASKFGGTAWKYVPELDEYYLHLFDETQADLNWENPRVRDEIVDILHFWMNKGIQGFRFDVVNLIAKPERFEDDPQGDGRSCYTDGPRVHAYLQEINERSFGSVKGIVTVGEMSSTSLDNCVRYAGKQSHELSMVFSFHHLKVDYKNKQKWELQAPDFEELKQLFHTWQLGMQKEDAWNALFWCNHDQPRIVSRFGNDTTYHKESAKMLATMIHMMRGTPYIYQGEEIGMTNAYFTDIRQYRDVESINYEQILRNLGKSQPEITKILQARSRDNARTPMQWNAHRHAGFTKGTPWIQVIDNYPDINVEKAQKEEDSILAYYQTLIQLRKRYAIIAKGQYAPRLEAHPQIFAYERTLCDESLIVVCNFYATSAPFTLSLDGYSCLLGNYPNKQNSQTLAPYEARVYYRHL